MKNYFFINYKKDTNFSMHQKITFRINKTRQIQWDVDSDKIIQTIAIIITD